MVYEIMDDNDVYFRGIKIRRQANISLYSISRNYVYKPFTEVFFCLSFFFQIRGVGEVISNHRAMISSTVRLNESR